MTRACRKVRKNMRIYRFFVGKVEKRRPLVHVAGVRCDPCDAMRCIAPQGSQRTPA